MFIYTTYTIPEKYGKRSFLYFKQVLRQSILQSIYHFTIQYIFDKVHANTITLLALSGFGNNPILMRKILLRDSAFHTALFEKAVVKTQQLLVRVNLFTTYSENRQVLPVY